MPSSIFLLLLLLTVAMPAFGEAAPSPNCPASCGDLTDIPYPFGIGMECSREGFHLTCNNTFNPPKAFLSNTTIEITLIRLSKAQALLKLRRAYDCYSTNGGNNRYFDSYGLLQRRGYPYIFSSTKNKFFGIGCDMAAYLSGTSFTSGCVSICEDFGDVKNGSCLGVGCCRTSIPKGQKDIGMIITSFNNHSEVHSFNPCSYAFLADEEWFDFSSTDLTNGSKYYKKEIDVPVVVDWILGNTTCEEASNHDPQGYACVSANSVCVNSNATGDDASGYICQCADGYRGNPYIRGHRGCIDVDECEDPERDICIGSKCTNTPGSYNCSCPEGTRGNPNIRNGCVEDKHQKAAPLLKVILAVTIPSVLIVILSIWANVLFQRRKLNKLKSKYFYQNGGSVLLKRIYSTEREQDSAFRIFTRDELEKATNKFDPSQILGRGGQGVVYKGTIQLDNDSNNNRMIAIKKSLLPDQSQIEEFINEIIILSQINHRNVVKLIGCCLEVENPLLVYEFIPNGTLFNHIHTHQLSWGFCLRVASETAGAIAYLHSSASNPILHRDIKSTNILLALDYTAKVPDFGASRLAPVNKLQVTTVVQGTLGYLDPEYMQSHQLTDKSDVYSFGVVLVELLTRREPLSYERNEEERSLSMLFITRLKENRLSELLNILDLNTDINREVQEVANLAKRCLSFKGVDRPTMVEVASELEGLRRSTKHPWVPMGIEEMESLLDRRQANDSYVVTDGVHSTGDGVELSSIGARQ